jgi:hypothetical protein
MYHSVQSVLQNDTGWKVIENLILWYVLKFQRAYMKIAQHS